VSSATEAKRGTAWWRNEDWLAVIVGGLLIAAVLAGWRPAPASYKWAQPSDLGAFFTPAALGRLLVPGVVFLVLSAVGVGLLGGRPGAFVGGYAVVFVLAWLAQGLAGHARASAYGIEYVIFALVLGLIVNHAVRLPDWLRQAVRTEFYLKSGLVVLGATILIQEILKAGFLGLVQAALVVTVVWGVAFRIARWLRVDDEFAAMLSSAVAICGVSAAIAACGAIQGDRKKLSYITSLVLIVAVPMMLAMPWIVKTTGMSHLVAGAWLGGTLDTTGSVTAAGELISPVAMKAGVIVKFSQNVLIGLAAFVLSVWWAMRTKGRDARGGNSAGSGVSARVIWERFPKFVLGFVGASLLFSFAVAAGTVKTVTPMLNGLRNLWFALAFVSIGLETHFGELLKLGGGRPAVAFVLAQAFNVVWTLLLAWLLFGGVMFPVPDLR
jgi:uncharacterized membrane protein YadS